MKEALKLALEALEDPTILNGVNNAKFFIKQALAQSEQEPFEYWNAVEGWVKIDEVRQHFDSVGCGTIYKTAGEDRAPLYASPPQRTWVGLTEEERGSVLDSVPPDNMVGEYYDKEITAIAFAIEAKLKEKNT